MRILPVALVFLSLLGALDLSVFVLQTEASAKSKAAKVEKKSERKMDEKIDPKSTFAFNQSGGFAGISRTYEKQLSDLTSEERNKLEQLIVDSGLLSVKDDKRMTPGAADMFYYDFSLKESKSTHHVAFDDGTLPQSYRPLVDFLKDKMTNNRKH